MKKGKKISYKWHRIRDLQTPPEELADPQLPSLSSIWTEQRDELEEMDAVKQFNERLLRQWAIETGIIERLYTLDEGTTQLLIEQGVDAAFISHESTNQDPQKVARLIQDQHRAVEGLFSFVANKRPLSTSYIKELHAELTQHQDTTEAIDSLGRTVDVDLLKGEYKELPNNPTRSDGTLHEYCPPEHAAAEMDQLLKLHREHMEANVAPEVKAAWLHHRFTQIHPFQDGNGRVARSLATLIFLKAGWLPLVITNEMRKEYIISLQKADQGDLQPLVNLFGKVERDALTKALGIIGDVHRADRSISSVIHSIQDTFKKRKETLQKEQRKAKKYSSILRQDAKENLDDLSVRLKRDLNQFTPPGKSFEAFAFEGKDGSDRQHWYRYQVFEVAKEFGYYVNLGVHHDWTCLGIELDGRSDILISVHGIGDEFRGLLVATACFYRKDDSDETSSAPITDFEPLVDETFSFNYREELSEIRERFQRWIDPVLVRGLEVFRRGL